MSAFATTTIEGIQQCTMWISSVSEVVQANNVSQYADKTLGWMGAIARIRAMAKAQLIEVDRAMLQRTAAIMNNNISTMDGLKYRVIDVLCATDQDYVNWDYMKGRLVELITLSDMMWTVLEIAARTSYKLIDANRAEKTLPGISNVI